MKTRSIDIKYSLKRFFSQTDWMKSILWLALITVGAYIFIPIFFFTIFIPPLALIILPLICLTWILLVFLAFWHSGYLVEVAKKEISGTDYIMDIRENISQRIKDGFKIIAAQMIYNIPLALFYTIAIILITISIFLFENNSNKDEEFIVFIGIALIVVGIITIFIGTVISLLIYFLWPAVIRQYVKYNTFGSMFEFNEIKNYIQLNIKNLLIILAILAVFGISYAIAIQILQLTIYICVGIILVPIGIAAGSLYLADLQGVLIGQMIKSEKNSK